MVRAVDAQGDDCHDDQRQVDRSAVAVLAVLNERVAWAPALNARRPRFGRHTPPHRLQGIDHRWRRRHPSRPPRRRRCVPRSAPTTTVVTVAGAAGHDVQATLAGHDVQATQAGHDVQATQAEGGSVAEPAPADEAIPDGVYYNDVDFSDPRHGMRGRRRCVIVATDDGGQSWHRQVDGTDWELRPSTSSALAGAGRSASGARSWRPTTAVRAEPLRGLPGRRLRRPPARVGRRQRRADCRHPRRR